jgi:hypothetical protein
MQRNGPPLLLLIAAFLAIAPSAHDFAQHSGDDKAPTAKVETSATNEAVPGEGVDPIRRARTAKELARLYDEFFGKPADPSFANPRPKTADTRKITIASPESTWTVGLDTPEELADPKNVLDKAKARTGCTTEFMIALVPDPLDSNLAISFDQAVSAIQMAFVDAGYLPDRFWLPWRGEAGKAKEYRTNSGILLYRKEGQCVLSTVFLVGETPKIGLQKEAFRQAVALIDSLTSRPRAPLRILGPSFSGSIESLEFFFSNDSACGYDEHKCRANIVTGSATSPKLEDLARLRCINVQRTVLQEPRFTERALSFLQSTMGWDLRRALILTESDTTYGQNELLRASEVLKDVTWAQFPSGLSGMRQAWEAKGEPGDRQTVGSSTFVLPKLTLDLSLAERSEPADTLPESDPLTTRNKDLAIANLLTKIRRESFRYVGIIATDPRDVIFLARRVKTFAPDTILFTIDNNLLYTHPNYQEFTDEMLVLSKYPLITETPPWRPLLGKPRDLKRYMRQFMTDAQQGVFEAAKILIDAPAPNAAAQKGVWIAAIGNGSLWPIVGLPEDAKGPSTKTIKAQCLPDSKHLFFLYMGIIILGTGYYLVFSWQELILMAENISAERPLHALAVIGIVPLWTMASVEIVIATLSFSQAEQIFFLGEAALVCSIFLWIFLTLNSKTTPLRTWKWWMLCAIPFLWVPAALGHFWMPGGAALLQMRTDNPSSGLSPMVSLFSACFSLVMWSFWEIKRRSLQIQQGFGWPLQDTHPVFLFEDCTLSARFDKLLETTVPPGRSRVWIVLCLLFIVPLFYLIPTIQPVAETSWYGRFFISLIAFGFSLSAISFFRFLSLWRILRMILPRLDGSEIPDRIRGLSAKIAWKPMQSFAWPLPVLKMSALSAEQLQSISRKYPNYERLEIYQKIQNRLKDVFDAHRAGRSEEQRAARSDLNKLFDDSFTILRGHVQDPDVASFFAIRLVSWLRHIFGHMRLCLIGSITSAGLLFFAVRTYAFEPKQFAFMSLWVIMLVVIILIFWVFFEMDRNATLSAIGNTDAGKISVNGAFVTNLLTYGVVPILGLAATQFPEIGRYFVSLLNPLLRVAGGS